MSGRIITARHGRPDLCRRQRISAKGYGEWWKMYEKSGLVAEEGPPAPLVDLASGATTVLSSTIPRAIETAQHVTKNSREVPQDSLFVEAPLPPPPIPWLRLRAGTWGVVSRFFWAFGYKYPDTETNDEAWRRVGLAAERLIEEAQKGDVLLCAHGYFNWMLDRHLRHKKGWERVAHYGENDYWSYRIYLPPEKADEQLEQEPAALTAS